MSLAAVKTPTAVKAELKRAARHDERPESDYRTLCKPKTADLLEALGLNVSFRRAAGNYAFYEREGDLHETAVLDLVGGFGACLFGHNNPEIREHLIGLLLDDRPAFVQGASRPEAARLACELNEHLQAKGAYYCNFVNSGAEAVEATIKHAYKVRFDAIREAYEDVSRRLNDFYHECDGREDPVELPEGFSDLSKFRDTIDEHNLGQFEDFQNNPVVCALKGSFHGKTTSALKLTFNKTYREAFEGLSSIKTVFFERNRPERVAEIIRDNQVSFLLPKLEGNAVVVETISMTKVIGLVMEIIQGEGGVRPVPDDTLRYLADAHDELGVPYIVDEIQTGFGRAGALALFENTPLGEIEPEYLVFGKALGGGILKISASLVHESVYDPDFGLLHTSTFGEDGLSCAVGSFVVEMLTREGGRMLDEINSKGRYFKSRLDELKKKHPSIIKEVRGRGLMLGLEFTDLNDFGPLFRYAGQKGFLSLLVASYLLHHHDVRVLAPLSTLFKGNPGKRRASIIRLQPPVTITRQEIDRFIEALDETLSVIASDDEFLLLAHLVGASPERIPDAPERITRRRISDARTRFDARIGFIVNVTRLEYLIEYYLPSFSRYRYDERRLAAWWNTLSRFLEPELIHRTYVGSEGFVVEVNIIVVPYLAESMIRLYAAGRHDDAGRVPRQRLKELIDHIQDAAIVARDLGDERIPTSIVGLGSFTSIVTNNGLDMNDYEIPITTGNAYTTGLMIQGFEEAATVKDVSLPDATVAVVGAGGNIGRILSTLLAFRVGRLVLIGRDTPEGREKVSVTRRECLRTILTAVAERVQNGADLSDIELDGIAGSIYESVIRRALGDEAAGDPRAAFVAALRDGSEPTDRDVDALEETLAMLSDEGEDALIVTGDMDDLRRCDLVAIATNSTNARLIGPDQVRKGAIVGCASVPSNLSKNFACSTDDHFVFDGGYARLPDGDEIDFVGMPRDGLAFGCLCETLLAGFDGVNKSFVKGNLNASHVLRTLEMAETYGFVLGDFQLSGVPLNSKKNES